MASEVPTQFTYPWGLEYQTNSWWAADRFKVSRRSPRPKFARKMNAHDKKMLNRITSSKRPSEADLGIHPDQPVLEVP